MESVTDKSLMSLSNCFTVFKPFVRSTGNAVSSDLQEKKKEVIKSSEQGNRFFIVNELLFMYVEKLLIAHIIND